MTVKAVPNSVAVRCDRCGTSGTVTQRCAPCLDALCPTCYGPWAALACRECRR